MNTQWKRSFFFFFEPAINQICAFLSTQIWEPLAQRFHRVIALDFLGFGFSDKPVSYQLFYRLIAWRSVSSLAHNSFSPAPDPSSDLTGTPSSSRPAWWRPWWLIWVWATSEWIWCPTTMETPWPWSCSTGTCVPVCLFITNSQKQSIMMNC